VPHAPLQRRRYALTLWLCAEDTNANPGSFHCNAANRRHVAAHFPAQKIIHKRRRGVQNDAWSDPVN